MMPERPSPTAAGPAERRQALWPWLLMPLAALTMFVLLKTAKETPASSTLPHIDAPANATQPGIAEER